MNPLAFPRPIAEENIPLERKALVGIEAVYAIAVVGGESNDPAGSVSKITRKVFQRAAVIAAEAPLEQRL